MENQDKNETAELHPALKKLWESGIPTRSITFQAEVDNANGTPNIKYDLNSSNKERRIEMVWTPHGVICRQKSVQGELEYWIVPPANYRSSKFA